MRHKLALTCLRTLALCLSLGSTTALAATVWYVDGVNGDDQRNCKSVQTTCATIGHSISLASPGDSVMIAPGTYKENLTINTSLKLIGSGATTTIIDGQRERRVVSIFNSTAIVGLSKVTIQNGVASGGGGILNWGTLTLTNSILSANIAASPSSAAGGGIYNSGKLTITNSTLSRNSGTSNYLYGGAIYNTGTLTITNSTLSGNTAYGYFGGGGGGIYNSSGSITIINTTLSGNSAHASGGGGIYNSSGSVAINNATLSGNTAAGYKGGGIFVAPNATVTLQNSIVANSSTAGNCHGTLTSHGYNLISHGYNLSSDNTCTIYFHISGDRNNVVGPLLGLGPLQNNGGPTFTHALLSGSPAIDKGNPSGCTDGKGHLLTTDQRGLPRPDREDIPEIPKKGCDRGAYERQMD